MGGYIFEHSDHREKIEGRFWNCQGKQIAIVAVVTKGIDWAAYIGADNSHSEDDTLAYAARYGSKLSASDAKHFYPEIELPYRG